MENSSGTKQILTFVWEEWRLIIILTILFFLYSYFTNTFDHFAKKGIHYKKPIIFFGNLWQRIAAKRSFHEFQLDVYNYFKGKQFGGMFEGRRPILYVFDPEIIKAITIRDFEHFVDRNQLNSNEPRYLKRTMINLKGVEWKGVCSAVTPAFSSARLKNMLPIVQNCTQQLVEYLIKRNKENINLKDIMALYTLEVIGAWAFGIKCDAIKDENAHFVKVAAKFNYMPKLKRFAIFFVLMFMPNLFKYLNISFMNRETTDELLKILKAAKNERRSSGERHNDFLQILIEAAEKEKKDATKLYMDEDTIDGQSLIFLIAGYETTSTLLSFAIHTLATNPELQEKMRSYIEEQTSDQELDYELLAKLSYLEAFLLETLRMYPPVARVDRACTKKYTIPGTHVTIDVGDIIAIPVYAIHMDPKYYPEPHIFKPERFMGEEKQLRPSHLFLAFGAGPRNCIGLRFSMVSAKLAMVSLLKKFKFSTCDQTQNPIQFDKKAFLLQAKDGLWVFAEQLKK